MFSCYVSFMGGLGFKVMIPVYRYDQSAIHGAIRNIFIGTTRDISWGLHRTLISIRNSAIHWKNSADSPACLDLLLIWWQEKNRHHIIPKLVVKNGDLLFTITLYSIQGSGKKTTGHFFHWCFPTNLKNQARQTGSFPHEIGNTTTKV